MIPFVRSLLYALEGQAMYLMHADTIDELASRLPIPKFEHLSSLNEFRAALGDIGVYSIELTEGEQPWNPDEEGLWLLHEQCAFYCRYGVEREPRCTALLVQGSSNEQNVGSLLQLLLNQAVCLPAAIPSTELRIAIVDSKGEVSYGRLRGIMFEGLTSWHGLLECLGDTRSGIKNGATG
ncbi:MAG: hypothetical protein K8I27_08065 [Planctomycetes bacterium]|nr:hypothetical protein [Planctomycetota bacterium]